MAARLHTHNDRPSPECRLGRKELLWQVAREIAAADPPLVFGVHGDWGAGKTSFLCQLGHELSGRCPLYPEFDANRMCADIDHVFPIWFEAWRYQHEPSPVVALLHELCRQLPRYQKVKDWLAKAGAVVTKGIFGTIEEVSADIEAKPLGTGGKVSVKARNPLKAIAEEERAWEESHFAGRLTSERIRELLSEAISKLVGEKPARVCIIIDDLDRCQPEAALRLIEGIKIFLSLDQCVFVLGINIRQIQEAIAPYLPGAKENVSPGEQQAQAAEYLEKLCTYTWKLPFLRPEECAALFRNLLADPLYVPQAQRAPLPQKLTEALAKTAVEFQCLPSNPRKIKALANTVRQLASQVWGPQGKPGHDIPVPIEDADALLVASSIYQFHPQLLRYLQTFRTGWTELVRWAGGKSLLSKEADMYKLLSDLRSVSTTDSSASAAPTPGSAKRVPAYADPIHLNVFRVEDLIRQGCDASARNSISPEQIARYLELPL